MPSISAAAQTVADGGESLALNRVETGRACWDYAKRRRRRVLSEVNIVTVGEAGLAATLGFGLLPSCLERSGAVLVSIALRTRSTCAREYTAQPRPSVGCRWRQRKLCKFGRGVIAIRSPVSITVLLKINSGLATSPACVESPVLSFAQFCRCLRQNVWKSSSGRGR
jgi:hypothetical protein